MPKRSVSRSTGPARARATPLESLEPRRFFSVGTLSEQIIVDQFGWRASAPRKVALFADPITGQNSPIAYTPGGTFQVRRTSDDAVVFTGNTAAWKAGATDTVSGDKVWAGDFSSLAAPGEYYLYDPTNNARSYAFVLSDDVFDPVLETAARAFYYQRTGTAIPAQFGGNWTHAIDHVGPNQDTQARLWQNGAPVAGSTPRDVSGGWFDAGDYNKYVPFTTAPLWNLLSAYEWNPQGFGDDWNLPESGNGAPDVLDEIKWEIDWLRKMQLADGSVMNRVANSTYASGSSDPATDTQARYHTAATTWATASFAASLAHAARVFALYENVYPGYAATLTTAAQNAWGYLQVKTTMFPANGSDGGTGLAAADAGANAGADLRLRILAAAELSKTTGTATYKTYFESNYKNSAASDNGQHPLLGGWPHFDTSLALELNRAFVTYATTPGANQSIVTEIRNSLRTMVNDQILPAYNNLDDPYRAFMWAGHYTWGSNQLKAEWANLLLYAIKLDVTPANNARYREIAEEYLHYFHGRNPLSYVYLSNMGSKGANLGAEKSAMQPYHSWFGDGSPLYDGANSTYGPAPGFLVGGPNQYFSVSWISPPYGEPAMKAFKDWNTAWNAQRGANENSWEITEPAIYYQAAYTLLASQFATPTFAQASAGGAYTITGNLGAQTLRVTAGTVTLSADAGASMPGLTLQIDAGATVVLQSSQSLTNLVLAPGATLDLRDRTLTIDYPGSATPAPAVAAAIASSLNAGRWNLPGLTSSLAASDADRATGVGYFDDGNTLRVRRTWYGDANLSGAVTADDVAAMLLAQSQNRTDWTAGNFNYDTRISPDDWALFAWGAARVAAQAPAASALSEGETITRQVLAAPEAD